MKQDMILKTERIDDNSVLIKKFIKGIEGGRTLDVSGVTDDVIPAGTVIASKTSEGSKTYFPLPLEGEEYRGLSEGEAYEGLLQNNTLKTKPAAAIMTWGIVNEAVLPYAVPSAFKEALPHIDYQKDEEA